MTAGRAYPAPSLRDFDARDTDTIASIWEDALRNAPPQLDNRFIANERHNLLNVYIPKTQITVACLNDIPVGFIAMNRREIAGLFVTPVCHGQGIGRRLVDRVRHGPLTVEVLFENTPAVGFYHHLGFVETGHRIHDTANRPVLRMRLT